MKVLRTKSQCNISLNDRYVKSLYQRYIVGDRAILSFLIFKSLMAQACIIFWLRLFPNLNVFEPSRVKSFLHLDPTLSRSEISGIYGQNPRAEDLTQLHACITHGRLVPTNVPGYGRASHSLPSSTLPLADP